MYGKTHMIKINDQRIKPKKATSVKAKKSILIAQEKHHMGRIRISYQCTMWRGPMIHPE